MYGPSSRSSDPSGGSPAYASNDQFEGAGRDSGRNGMYGLELDGEERSGNGAATHGQPMELNDSLRRASARVGGPQREGQASRPE